MTELAKKEDAVPFIKTSAARGLLIPEVDDRIYYYPARRFERWTGSGWVGDAKGVKIVSLTYGTTVYTDAALGNVFELTVTDTTAFTMAAPTNPEQGWEITYNIKNSSGGAMGTITWNGAFKLAGSFTNPANGKLRTISFYYDGTNWIELNRAAADI